MKTALKFLPLGIAAMSALLLSASANAATIQCNDPLGTGDTRFVLLADTVGTPDPACFASGETNEPYKNTLWKIDFPDSTSGTGPDPFDFFERGDGYSGSFAFRDDVVFSEGALIVFKFGGGQNTPDWFAFTINGLRSASWSLECAPGVENCLNALSHVAVYGEAQKVPEPATLALLGLGLMGLGLRARRRQAA